MEKAWHTGGSLRSALAFKSDDATLQQVSANSCDLWINKYIQMYMRRANLSMRIGVNHYNIVTDASTHSCRDTLASVCYSWEQDIAVHMVAQAMPPGKDITHFDQGAMPGAIALLCAERKLQRVAAWRQLQALSNQLSLLAGKTLDDFQLPPDVFVQAVASPDDVRVVRRGPPGGTDEALIWTSNGSARRVLPAGLETIPLLVAGLDQGSIGSAGMAYAINELQCCMHTKFDKFHRIVRDIKLSISHSCSGVFQKAMLYSSYLWSLNYKPFGSGGFSSLKNRLLTTFLATESCESPIFQKYSSLIAQDFQMPASDLQVLWEEVAAMPSFHLKKSLPKQGRWFSWNQAAEEQLREFHASRMIFEHHCGDMHETSPDLLGQTLFQIHRVRPGLG